MMFVTTFTFGLIYDGALIVEEAKKGTSTKEELECRHISIGINHSIIEDPVFFSAVQAYRGINYLKNSHLRHVLRLAIMCRKKGAENPRPPGSS